MGSASRRGPSLVRAVRAMEAGRAQDRQILFERRVPDADAIARGLGLAAGRLLLSRCSLCQTQRRQIRHHRLPHRHAALFETIAPVRRSFGWSIDRFVSRLR